MAPKFRFEALLVEAALKASFFGGSGKAH